MKPQEKMNRKEKEKENKKGARSSLKKFAKRLLKKRQSTETSSSLSASTKKEGAKVRTNSKKRSNTKKLKLREKLKSQNSRLLHQEEAERLEKARDFSVDSLSEELDLISSEKIKELRDQFKQMKNLETVGDFSAKFGKMLEEQVSAEMQLNQYIPAKQRSTEEDQKIINLEQMASSMVLDETLRKSRRVFSLISSDDEDEVEDYDTDHDDYQLGMFGQKLAQTDHHSSEEEMIMSTNLQTRVVSKGAAGLQSLMSESVAHIDFDSSAPGFPAPSELSESTSMYSARSHRTKRESIKLTKQDLSFLPQLMSVLKAERIKEWASRFRRADPRYQIMQYFDDVAKLGVNNVAKEGQVNADKISPILKMWNRSSIFTVWRPTSMDAIRLMMKGEGVGKGLDIKGKSAKKGNISGFVPFLQIYEEHHKSQIRTLPKNSTTRIFFQTEELRDEAAARMSQVAKDMIIAFDAACEVLQTDTATDEEQEAALEKFMWELEDPEIVIIDDHAENKAYGVEVPERVFWETYVMRQNIYRELGTEYHTGRPSEPAFQDMNFSSLRHKPQPNRPRPVVYQKDTYNAMEPRNLLVAYEENGRVLPVVSDFDCFLAGTRCVAYEAPLPDDQVDLVKWGISNIESILEGEPSEASWTSRWLNVLKQDHVKPTMPPFGFGDPKSYSLMELAVERLNKDGCVRHGAECFNFYFPQELDDYFLVIGEGINDNDSGPPWKYVDVEGLQEILLQKANDGYAFPLNPKWVLCDPGWKEIYDVLISSQASNVQESMNCWFPPESGIREKIEEISERFPDGFVQVRPDCQHSISDLSDCSDGSEDGALEDPDENDGTAAMDLAEEQLRRYQTLQRAKKKLKIVLMWMSFAMKTGGTAKEHGALPNSSEADSPTEQLATDVAASPKLKSITAKRFSPRRQQQLKFRHSMGPLTNVADDLFLRAVLDDGARETISKSESELASSFRSEDSFSFSTGNDEVENRDGDGEKLSGRRSILKDSLLLMKLEIPEEPEDSADQDDDT